MSREKRREIPEWVTWLALWLLLLLAPLPFVTEENADQLFRVLPLVALFIVPLIMMFVTMFPQGLRLPLGRWSLRIAPPAAYFISYYSASRWLKDERSRYLEIADRLDAMRGKQDAAQTRINALIDEVIVAGDAERFFGLSVRTYTNYDSALGAEIAAEMDLLREMLAQPSAATTGGILDQHAAWASAIVAALRLIRARMVALDAFADDTLDQGKEIAIDALTRLERHIRSEAAKIAAIEAEVAAEAQSGPGRPKGSGYWTDDKLRVLHAEYVNRGKTTSNAFAKDHGIDKSHMLKSFKRLGLSAEP